MDIIDIHGATIILSVPPFLVRDFVSYEFNGRKLRPVTGQEDRFVFETAEVHTFREHMEAPWPGVDRRDPPDFVQRYLTFESRAVCAFCRQPKPNYQFAHITPWARTRSNSPHNLLRLCLDCHTSHGNDTKLLRAVKEELIRETRLTGQSPIYDCTDDIGTGEAVFVVDGIVYRADANDLTKTAAGLLLFKFGSNRCTVQRPGVFQGMSGLQTGETYFLSHACPGAIVTWEDFDKNRDETRQVWHQKIGRAEGPTQLAISIESPIGLGG